MAEEKMKTTLEKIEGLIVDGNKEVLERIGKVEERLDGRIDGIENRIGGLEEGQERIIEGIKKIDKKHDINAEALHDLLTGVRNDVKRVENKLDEHMLLPSHAQV